MRDTILVLSYVRVSEGLSFVSHSDDVVSWDVWFASIVSMCVSMLCCKMGVEIRLLYMFDPTILSVYGGEDSVVIGYVVFVVLEYDVFSEASAGRFREGSNCPVVTYLLPRCVWYVTV